MSTSQILSPSSSSTTHRLLTATHRHCYRSSATATLKVPSSVSLRLQQVSLDGSLKSDLDSKSVEQDVLESTPNKFKKETSPEDEEEEEEGILISRIQVPRQKFISVSKSELLDAIISTMFHSQDEKDQFRRISS